MINFQDLKEGAQFAYGGNLWVKQSTRTARIIAPEYIAGRWFYFGAQDNVKPQKEVAE